jgi:hypothetical protein
LDDFRKKLADLFGQRSTKSKKIGPDIVVSIGFHLEKPARRATAELYSMDQAALLECCPEQEFGGSRNILIEAKSRQNRANHVGAEPFGIVCEIGHFPSSICAAQPWFAVLTAECLSALSRSAQSK